MGNTTVWDLYLKTQEMRHKTIEDNAPVSIEAIAAKLAIDSETAEECAIVLQKLELIKFNTDRKEITLF